MKKGTLIEIATTGADGTAKFTADLPIGYSYSVKEDQAPEGYVRNTEDVYTFKFSYTNDKEATVSLSLIHICQSVRTGWDFSRKNCSVPTTIQKATCRCLQHRLILTGTPV